MASADDKMEKQLAYAEECQGARVYTEWPTQSASEQKESPNSGKLFIFHTIFLKEVLLIGLKMKRVMVKQK